MISRIFTGQQAPIAFSAPKPLSHVQFSSSAHAQPYVIPNALPMSATNMGYYQQLARAAQELAKPAVTNYKVGAVLVGESGRVYLGNNVEIKGGIHTDTLHAEP